MPSLTLRPDEALTGTLDVEATAKQIPIDFQVKGMFFARLVGQLGSGFPSVASRLASPPRLGRYLPFSDYPQADYVRLSGATAQKVHPGLPLREALRRLGREDIQVFGASTFGKVIMSAVGDARTALNKTPYIYEKMAPGGWAVRGHELDASTYRISFAPVYGSWEYQLGQLEGLVMNFGGSPSTVVTELDGRMVQFDVRHC